MHVSLNKKRQSPICLFVKFVYSSKISIQDGSARKGLPLSKLRNNNYYILFCHSEAKKNPA
jgi:hypothetical protein